ncbi:MAG: peptide chain release factor N(5)-glutamine methyltransferase [Acidobacteriota bacterium]|nr:peptide chain release factor N(5)-glutamine methyltransferase [Blastocatellia bacterium]MDW8411999.1 peptide chain release factor N(5)-glutamine methyltransferase [Acidobacteriota bacterium]
MLTDYNLSTMMTIKDALEIGRHKLSNSKVDRPKLTAELLLAAALGKDRIYLLAHDDESLDEYLKAAYEVLIARRAAGEPLQYILGKQEFYGLDFLVSPAVLIPRPETEAIVEAVLKHAASARSILDIGTGSGCIAITLAKLMPHTIVTAVDISMAAIKVANQNAKMHGVSDRIDFLVGDLCSALAGSYDVICSNPPYVAVEEKELLPAEVREHEPHIALFAPEAGLSIIKRIFLEARQLISPQGLLVMEIGYGQAKQIENASGNLWKINEILKDLQGIPRTVLASPK